MRRYIHKVFAFYIVMRKYCEISLVVNEMGMEGGGRGAIDFG